jgi:aldose 1-epimerase
VEWSIELGAHAAVIDETGGGLRSYHVDGEPVVDGYAAGERPPGGAGQVLAPWPNRIRDGRYDFAGRTHELTLTEPEHSNAIHGLVRRLPWQAARRGTSAITVECTISNEPGYPFGLRLVTTWSLTDDGLRVEHEADGLGPGPAPFGLGVHPYLLVPDVPADELDLTVPAAEVVSNDERGLPTELTPVAQSQLDFRSPRRIGGTVIDNAFTGIGPERTVRLAGAHSSVELWLDESFRWVQVFTADTLPEPRRRRSVAVEPMTCPADAFNSGTDLITLEPGQTWRGSWGIRPRRNVRSSATD